MNPSHGLLRLPECYSIRLHDSPTVHLPPVGFTIPQVSSSPAGADSLVRVPVWGRHIPDRAAGTGRRTISRQRQLSLQYEGMREADQGGSYDGQM
ncbi:hypothetical protein CKAH01_15249 [Colletotrichum kahawae]|uniref:Uncharacterized protein n=1 Tax=Colletotrichum kahawae TaxID=34407 RepID=A0AAD9YJ92_COLKA|nr:hypothetical protein CKAH01_15249 [Colletotrichum kahawae]